MPYVVSSSLVPAPPQANSVIGEAAVAHEPVPVGPGRPLVERAAREERDNAVLASGATRAIGAGRRLITEEPDPYRTCFERDLDRIQHSRPFRRLAGKCQVFIAPENDHLRTRLTHAIEVAQVAVSIARPVGLNVALTAAAATGHDCGHGPAGHASEGALSPFVPGGYHHAVYGANVVLAPLNLCAETLDAIRNHSWNRPTPMTPEGEVVAWADRIAYVCHDFEDALSAGIVGPDDLPDEVRNILGNDRRSRLSTLINAMIDTIATTGVVAMRKAEADALAAFRAFDYNHIYLRDESVAQADRAAQVIAQMCEYFIEHPAAIEHHQRAEPTMSSTATGDTADHVADVVRYVSGMTDRYLFRLAVDELGWNPSELPLSA